MTDDTFSTRIAEARRQIDELPEAQRGPLRAALDESLQRHEALKADFARLREALSDWQLMVKYLIFDREATIRERDELRRKLGNADA